MGCAIVRWLCSACAVLALLGAGRMALASSQADLPASAAAYDFAYRLSGDRRVAPVQVFDDGRTTWLQFQPGQTLPAVFVATPDDPAGGQLATYTQQGPYLVLNGTAGAFVLRIGAISARAEYIGRATRTGLALVSPGIVSQWGSDAPSAVPVASVQHALANDGPPGQLGRPAASLEAGPIARSMAQESSVLEFDVSLTDKNMRTALGRWARQAGWTFQPEHWATDVDIPLAGVAAFGADFRHAVRTLLSSTELAERPLQPCFYSNRVLRVVPLTHACDRTAAPASSGFGQS